MSEELRNIERLIFDCKMFVAIFKLYEKGGTPAPSFFAEILKESFKYLTEYNLEQACNANISFIKSWANDNVTINYKNIQYDLITNICNTLRWKYNLLYFADRIKNECIGEVDEEVSVKCKDHSKYYCLVTCTNRVN